MSPACCVPLPQGVMGLSTVCDCGIVIVVFPHHTHYFLTIFSLIFIYLCKAFTFSINGRFLQSFTSTCSVLILLKTRYHYADVAMVHPDARQSLYLDEPGHVFFKKKSCFLTSVKQ